MKKDIYIIIGEGGTGKSSLVRALTGTYQGGIEKIEFSDQTSELFKVWTRSAQEGEYYSPERVLRNIDNTDQSNILLTLRATGKDNANDYIGLISASHNIVGIVVLGNFNNIPMPNTIKPLVIADPWERPTNGNASRVREFWNWS